MACEKRLVRSKSGLRIVASDEGTSSPFMLCEPPWIPDNQCRACMQCQTKFDFLHRRHHCRRCGQCFCGSCCEDKVPLPRMCFVDPVRMCAPCAQTTLKENEFFDRHLKTLVNGGGFQVITVNVSADENAPQYLCKLSSDHRYIQFESQTEEDPDSVDLTHVESVQIITSGTDPQGNMMGTGINIKYKDEDGSIQNVKLLAPDAVNKRQAMLWVAAMQKAVKMLYENRENRIR